MGVSGRETVVKYDHLNQPRTIKKCKSNLLLRRSKEANHFGLAHLFSN